MVGLSGDLVLDDVAYVKLGGGQVMCHSLELRRIKAYRAWTQRPSFPITQELRFVKCEKNFLDVWMDPSMFPKVKTIYLFSHPCEPRTFFKFSDEVTIIVHPDYEDYVRRWAPNRQNAVVREFNVE